VKQIFRSVEFVSEAVFGCHERPRKLFGGILA
jgi:hypothetical protein